MSDNLLQTLYAYLSEVFANLLGQESEEVHHIFGTTHKTGSESFVLRGNTHGAGVGITLAHHYATQYNQGQRTERELVGT